MKTPRVKDFDPDAKVPTLKSSMDKMPIIGKPLSNFLPQTMNSEGSIKKMEVKKDDTNPVRPVRDVLPVQPVLLKRVMKSRWPIDIYQDQYESLQKLALEQKMQGGIGSMSAMVREAIDKLIKERRK